MKIKLSDRRDEDVMWLGFISVEDGDNHLCASVSIYKNREEGEENIYFENFMSGNIGKYEFQSNRQFEEITGGCGRCFQGAGRGRKTDKSFEDMKEFINKVADLELKVSDFTLKEVKKYETIYELEV